MKKTICLVDGSGYIFRAFYALPPMNNPQGIPVNAVYGFTNMFLKLTNNIKCDYSLVLFDAKRQNFRNEIFHDYKGTRKETPEDLIPQFSLIRDAVEALNLNQLEMEGYEADDLIATYAKMAENDGLDVVIVSADKDLMQLIDENIKLYDPMKDKFFSDEDVKEKFGVYPNKVVDVQALAGDAIDNVPGVPGIGIKTAAELINEFGSMEEVLLNADKIKQNKRRELIIANKENAIISKKLVTLKSDVPVQNSYASYTCKKPEAQKIMSFIEKHAFKTIKPRVENWLKKQCTNYDENTENSAKEIVSEYKIVNTIQELKQCVTEISKSYRLAFSIDNNPQFQIAICANEGRVFYISCSPNTWQDDLFSDASKKQQLTIADLRQYLFPLFSCKSILKIGSQIKNSLHIIKQVFQQETDVFPIDDVAVMTYVADGTKYDLTIQNMAKYLLNYDMKFQSDKVLSSNDKAKNLSEQADMIFRLYNVLKNRLIEERQISVYENFDRPIISILYDMEENGILIDSSKLEQLNLYFEEKIKTLENEIYTLTNESFNLSSPKQIGEILYKKLELKSKKTAKGSYKTDAQTLELLAEENELPAKILQWRTFAKLKSTYTSSILDVADINGRVHTTFNQNTVNTGRLSSSNPNLQNIPIRTEEGRKIREVFIAPKGCKIVSADYSQAELRLLADVANVHMLKEAFEKGIDVHAATAAKVFNIAYENVDSEHRRKAKAINFGIVYGISPFGLAKQIGSTPDLAKGYIDNYFLIAPEIKEYMQKTIQYAQEYGYVLTPFGRKCIINGINDSNKRIAAFAQRAAINAPIQGGAADIVKLAMKKVAHKITENKLKSKILLQIHDELVLEVPDNELDIIQQLLRENMENVVKLSVSFPIEIGIGDNWEQAH